MPFDYSYIENMADAMEAVEKIEGREEAYKFGMEALNVAQESQKLGWIIILGWLIVAAAIVIVLLTVFNEI